MAKGDKKSRKGKIAMGTYGNTRRRRALKTAVAPAAPVAAAASAAPVAAKAKAAPKKK